MKLPRLVLVLAMDFFGALCVAAAFWSFLWSFPLVGIAIEYRNAPGYRPAVFVVESVSYYSGDVHNPDVNPTAHGRVEGNEESLTLGPFLERSPRDEADLAAMVPAGREFKVLYNPRVTRAPIQSRHLRVLPYRDGLEQSARERLVHLATLGFGPLLVLFPLTLIATLLVWRTAPAEELLPPARLLLGSVLGWWCLLTSLVVLAFEAFGAVVIPAFSNGGVW